MFENTDWGGILVTTILSSVIAGVIAWYFRFRAKPKIEIVYENNRNASFKILWLYIQLYLWSIR